jgi:serine/threonine protein kinase
MYAAPEVTYRSSGMGGLRRHGRSSDIFALGCVFCDMISVWKGQSLSEFHEYLSQADSASYGSFRYSDAIPMVEEKLQSSILFFQCVQPMLAFDRSSRPTAAETLRKMLSLDRWSTFDCDCVKARSATLLAMRGDTNHAT